MKCSYNYFENHKVPLLKKNQYALLSLSLVQHEEEGRKEKKGKGGEKEEGEEGIICLSINE